MINLHLVNVREIKEDEINFVLSSFIKSNRFGLQTKYMLFDIYLNMHKPMLIDLCAADSTKILVAEYNGFIYGYIIYDDIRNVIHYYYVKQSFRKLGIGGLLIKNCNFDPNKVIFFSLLSDSITHKCKLKLGEKKSNSSKLKREILYSYNPNFLDQNYNYTLYKKDLIAELKKTDDNKK